MIDVIIPAYNANETIHETLLSINKQTIKDLCKIYIINDGSECDYKNEISMFKEELNITEIKLNINSGPGMARQVGINASRSEYIIFIDSDDEFYDCNSLEKIFNTIKNSNYDIVVGNMVEVRDNYIKEYKVDFNVLHSKLYRRKFIKDNGIGFPNLYHSEDVAFNDLCLIFNPKIGYCNDLIYTYKRRKNSLTYNDYYYPVLHIKYYIQCEIWVITRAKENNVDAYEIAKKVISSFVYLYSYFCNDMEDETIKYIYCFIKYYHEYEGLLSEKEKLELLYSAIEKISEYPINLSYEEFLKICEENYNLETNV